MLNILLCYTLAQCSCVQSSGSGNSRKEMFMFTVCRSLNNENC